MPRKSKQAHLDVLVLEACQRCGKTHEMLRFVPLYNPIDEYKWWALCPATKQPILMRTYPVPETDN